MQNWQFVLVKYLVTALVIVAVSEIARFSGRLGALITALPLVTVMVLIWMQVEGRTQASIAEYASYTLWYVIPTLPFFVVFPLLITRTAFPTALGLATVVTMLCFILFAVAVKRFDIDLF